MLTKSVCLRFLSGLAKLIIYYTKLIRLRGGMIPETRKEAFEVLGLSENASG